MARIVQKGFQSHFKQSRLIRNTVQNLSRLDSKKKKKKRVEMVK